MLPLALTQSGLVSGDKSYGFPHGVGGFEWEILFLAEHKLETLQGYKSAFCVGPDSQPSTDG